MIVPMITFITADGVELQTTLRQAFNFNLIASFYGEEVLKEAEESSESNFTYPLKEISSHTLKQIFEYLDIIKNEKPIDDDCGVFKVCRPLISNRDEDIIKDTPEHLKEKLTQFIKHKSLQETTDMLLATNFLDIRPLKLLFCAKISTMLIDEEKEKIKLHLATLRGYREPTQEEIQRKLKAKEEADKKEDERMDMELEKAQEEINLEVQEALKSTSEKKRHLEE